MIICKKKVNRLFFRKTTEFQRFIWDAFTSKIVCSRKRASMCRKKSTLQNVELTLCTRWAFVKCKKTTVQFCKNVWDCASVSTANLILNIIRFGCLIVWHLVTAVFIFFFIILSKPWQRRNNNVWWAQKSHFDNEQKYICMYNKIYPNITTKMKEVGKYLNENIKKECFARTLCR